MAFLGGRELARSRSWLDKCAVLRLGACIAGANVERPCAARIRAPTGHHRPVPPRSPPTLPVHAQYLYQHLCSPVLLYYRTFGFGSEMLTMSYAARSLPYHGQCAALPCFFSSCCLSGAKTCCFLRSITFSIQSLLLYLSLFLSLSASSSRKRSFFVSCAAPSS